MLPLWTGVQVHHCWCASTCVIIFTWGVCCGIIGWVVIGEEDNSHSINGCCVSWFLVRSLFCPYRQKSLPCKISFNTDGCCNSHCSTLDWRQRQQQINHCIGVIPLSVLFKMGQSPVLWIYKQSMHPLWWLAQIDSICQHEGWYLLCRSFSWLMEELFFTTNSTHISLLAQCMLLTNVVWSKTDMTMNCLGWQLWLNQ